MVITRCSVTNLIKTTLFFIIALKCADGIGLWQAFFYLKSILFQRQHHQNSQRTSFTINIGLFFFRMILTREN